MKVKNQKKALVLNKSTIAHLQQKDLDSIKGGTFSISCNCTLFCTNDCPEISVKEERCN